MYVYLKVLCVQCICMQKMTVVLGVGCVILLWHSLGLPYNYFSSEVDLYATVIMI